jgi:hypothetical protein
VCARFAVCNDSICIDGLDTFEQSRTPVDRLTIVTSRPIQVQWPAWLISNHCSINSNGSAGPFPLNWNASAQPSQHWDQALAQVENAVSLPQAVLELQQRNALGGPKPEERRLCPSVADRNARCLPRRLLVSVPLRKPDGRSGESSRRQPEALAWLEAPRRLRE